MSSNKFFEAGLQYSIVTCFFSLLSVSQLILCTVEKTKTNIEPIVLKLNKGN